MSKKKGAKKETSAPAVQSPVDVDDGPFGKLLPREIDETWSQEMADSLLFDDEKEIRQAKKNWLLYLSQNIKNFRTKEDFADFVLLDAKRRVDDFIGSDWECLVESENSDADKDLKVDVKRNRHSRLGCSTKSIKWRSLVRGRTDIGLFWSQEMADSLLFDDEKEIRQAKKNWLLYLSQNIKNFRTKEDFADFVLLDAKRRVDDFIGSDWECLVESENSDADKDLKVDVKDSKSTETTPSTSNVLISEFQSRLFNQVNEEISMKYSNLNVVDNLTKEKRERFIQKVNFLCDAFVTNSHFQFRLFQSIFQSTDLPMSVSFKSFYTYYFPTKYYPVAKKKPNSKPFATDSIIDLPIDYILPLQMATEINDEFWMKLEEEIEGEATITENLV